MEAFVESLRKGRLTTSKCLSCGQLIWPPNNACPRCISDNVAWVEVNRSGRLIEFSESSMTENPSIFGIVELDENIRLLGKINCENYSKLERGMSVRLIKCGIENNNAYYEFQPV